MDTGTQRLYDQNGRLAVAALATGGLLVVASAGPARVLPSLILVLYLILMGMEDLLTRRIPNTLCLFGLGAGLVLQVTTLGWGGGLLNWASGLALGLGLLLPFWLFGGLGAGDVKGLAGAGALVGWGGVLSIFVYAALLGGVVASAMLLRRGLMGRAAMRLYYLYSGLWQGRWQYIPPSPQESRLSMPYGTILAAGGLCLMAFGPAV
jgi:prepilin peptidase CpaA